MLRSDCFFCAGKPSVSSLLEIENLSFCKKITRVKHCFLSHIYVKHIKYKILVLLKINRWTVNKCPESI